MQGRASWFPRCMEHRARPSLGFTTLVMIPSRDAALGTRRMRARVADERAASGAQGQDVDGRPGGDPDLARPEGISVEDIGAVAGRRRAGCGVEPDREIAD